MASQFLRKHKRKPSFFKVLIHDFSTRLQIPPAFIKEEFGKDELPKKTTLATYNGRSWKVGVEKLGKKFYFNNGWDKFMQDNRLENADFLVLKYFAEYSKFKVKIYGKTCCEKRLNVVVGKTCSKPLKGKQDQRNKQEKRERKRDEEEEEEDDDDDDIVKNDRESKALKDEVIKVDPDSSFSFDDDDDDEQEIGGNQKRRKAQSVKSKRNDNYGGVPADHRNHIKFKSENRNPFFQFQLGYSTSNFYLHIPKGFFKEHMKENKRMKLDVSERTWNLEINVYEYDRPTTRKEEARVTKGWKRLVEEHHLKMGDVCIFEMIDKSYDSDDHYVFLVHVYKWDHQKAEFSKII